jgi:hypothetical protein
MRDGIHMREPRRKEGRFGFGEAGKSVRRDIYSILWVQASKLARSAQIIVI